MYQRIRDYHYADYWALDGPNVCGSSCPYSLSDFFNFPAGANSFGTAIATPYDGTNTYNADFFIKYNKAAQDPDNEIDDD